MNNIKFLYNLILSTNPQKSDAIIWLQGDCYDRGKKVLALYRDGWSKKIILTGNNKLLSPQLRPGEKNISLEKMHNWLKKRGVSYKNIEIENQSLNTKDQAENIVNLARKNNWSSILLVGSSYYQPRAFLTFLRYAEKNNWAGVIINQPFFVNKNKIPGGWSETSDRLFEKEIRKIKLYKRDLSLIKTGVAYMKDKFFRVKLRSAKLSDAKFLFELRNDPITRRNSFQQQKINFTEHSNWFKENLVNKDKLIYIIYNENNKKIGQVRFDIKNKTANINISLVETCRGLGYGKETISYASNYFLAKFGRVNSIVAKIKQDNKSSLLAFKKSGYKTRFKKDGVYNLIFEYK